MNSTARAIIPPVMCELSPVHMARLVQLRCMGDYKYPCLLKRWCTFCCEYSHPVTVVCPF